MVWGYFFQMSTFLMLFSNHLQSYHMLSLQSSVNKNQIGTKIFVKDVCMGGCSCQDAENISHALILNWSKVQISAISLGDGLLNQSWPNFNISFNLFASHEK